MERVKRLFTHCFLLAVTLTVGLSLIAYASLEPIFGALGAQPEVMPIAIRYMSVWLLGMPFFAVALVGANLMRAAGDAVRPGILMTIGSGLHIVIAPFFVFGWGPAPEMGAVGAALGFVLARTVSLCMYTYVILIKDRMLVPSLDGMVSSCRDILHVGLPAIMSNLIGPMSMGIITRLLAAHGAAVVAGYGVASRVDSMVMMILFALSTSVAPFVGQNWGARRFDRVNEALRLACRFSIAWGLLSFAILVRYGELLVSLINDDPAVIQAASIYLIVLPISIGLMGVMVTCTSCFNALGKPLPPFIISVCQMLVVYVPLAMLGDYLFGYVGIFLAATVTNILLGFAAWGWVDREIRVGVTRLAGSVQAATSD